jgi:hypothetical protein
MAPPPPIRPDALSRRDFLSAAVAAPLLSVPFLEERRRLPVRPLGDLGRASRGPSSILGVNHRALLARADLRYDSSPPRSEEGIPVGNGTMGSLVWTMPEAVRFQINRVDVYPSDSASRSFPERHSDYCGGCGFVDIGLSELGGSAFPSGTTTQRLSAYEGLAEIHGDRVDVRVAAWPHGDVIAVEIDDRRATPEPVRVDLRMLRFATPYLGGELEELVATSSAVVVTREHRAESRLLVRGDRIVLTQEFREGDHLNRTAVAVGIVRRGSRARIVNEQTVRVSAPAAPGGCTLLIGSAASFDPDEDVIAAALGQLETAAEKGFTTVAAETGAWWHDYWTRGFVHLHSEDGVADFVEQNYNYFLYLMGATSRGAFPPKFNGMLWNTGGDVRSWGSQHWFANLSCYYEAIPATGRLELMEPVFSMYSGMREASALAARQQWGSEGIFIPETVFFDGLAELPDEIAAEMRDLYLVRKPWEERSQRFRDYAASQLGHSSRWNWIASAEWEDGQWVIEDKGAGPFGHVNHILGTTAKVAYLYWRQYEFTLDRAWLAEHGYPMLRDAAEFYRHFPNLRRGADGKYHLHHVNSNESVLGATDPDEDLSALRGLLPAAIRAAEILDRDRPLRDAWAALLRDLAPIPTSDLPGALRPEDYAGPAVFVRGRRPLVRGENAFLPDRNSLPAWFFDLCHAGSSDAERLRVANATFDAFFRTPIGPETNVSVLSKVAIAGAALGRVEATRHLIPSQILSRDAERDIAYRDGGVLANRMMLREGPQALDAQRLGRAAEAVNLALLQSYPPEPAGVPVLRVFPAWPPQWEAAFTLRARGAFLVTSEMRGGRTGFVELESLAGSECRLLNPWSGEPVDLHRDGAPAETLEGDLLTFATRTGERIVLVRSGDTPAAHARTLPG